MKRQNVEYGIPGAPLPRFRHAVYLGLYVKMRRDDPFRFRSSAACVYDHRPSFLADRGKLSAGRQQNIREAPQPHSGTETNPLKLMRKVRVKNHRLRPGVPYDVFYFSWRMSETKRYGHASRHPYTELKRDVLESGGNDKGNPFLPEIFFSPEKVKGHKVRDAKQVGVSETPRPVLNRSLFPEPFCPLYKFNFSHEASLTSRFFVL